MSLAVVGADYPNKRGPLRRFEIAICKAGEAVTLKREPKNPADSRAIGVYSCRDVQIGYIRAEQAQWIGSMLDSISAIFQRPDSFGAVIRVSFDGSVPKILSEHHLTRVAARVPRREPSGWPPPDPDDDYVDI